MDRKDRTDLFLGAFAQEDTFADGTGLGLNLVRTILKAIGGSIEVESEQNIGTTVTATIPLVKPGPGGQSTTITEHDALFKPPEGFMVAIPTATPDPTGHADKSNASRAIAPTLLAGSMIKACSENGITTIPWDSTSSQYANVQLCTEAQVHELLPTEDEGATERGSPPGQEVRIPGSRTGYRAESRVFERLPRRPRSSYLSLEVAVAERLNAAPCSPFALPQRSKRAFS